MSAEEVSTSVIFRGCFEEMNFKIFSLLSSEVSDIKEEVLELDFYSNIIFSILLRIMSLLLLWNERNYIPEESNIDALVDSGEGIFIGGMYVCVA